MGFELFADQILLADRELFTFGVPGELDHFHAIEECRRDRGQRVRGGDEKHLRQVERDFHVVIAEGVVLFGVEDFEQRRRWIPAEITA